MLFTPDKKCNNLRTCVQSLCVLNTLICIKAVYKKAIYICSAITNETILFFSPAIYSKQLGYVIKRMLKLLDKHKLYASFCP